MRENNRNSIEKCRKKLPQFTTMNVIDGQAGLIIYTSLIFYSLTIDNILNIIVLLILVGISISMLTGQNGILGNRNKKKKLLKCKILTRTKIYKKKELPTLELLKKVLGKDFNLCPQCKKGHMLIPNTT